jgi:hypothetical protein
LFQVEPLYGHDHECAHGVTAHWPSFERAGTQ